jgi:type I restriction enzyme S subunit
MQMTAKSSVDSVRRDMIARMLIPLPPLSEQCAIAAVLSDVDAEIAALETRREKTRALKQGMMQELLTGRIRLV